MKKIKLLGYFILFCGLFFVSGSGFISAFSYITEPHTLTDFSDGSSTFGPVTFPAGGGTLCDTYPPADANCPTVTLPCDAIVTSASVTISETGTPIGTPYIWIPNSGSSTLVQMRTSDGTLVKLYQNNADGFPGSAFSNPSRVTVMPGGDVYVANRGNRYVTRLTPKPSPLEEYEYGGQLDMGAGENLVRAATFDRDGNIWAGTCNSASGTDKLKVFCGKAECGIGTELASLANGKCNYGMIGDGYGIVWSVGGGTLTSYSYSAGTITKIDSDAVANSYGIGIDNDANIWVGRWKNNGSAFKVIRDSSGNISSVTNYSSGVGGGGRGIAGDKDNNNWLVINDNRPAWTTNSSRVIKYDSSGSVIGNFSTGTGSTGAAVDADNNIWIVNYGGGAPGANPVLNPSGCGGNGSVTKLASDGSYIATYKTCGNNPYNYSDMTGLRTVPKSMSVSTGTVPGVTSGSDTIFTGPAFVAALNTALLVGGSGYCEIPLKIYSMTAGDFTLKDLEIKYNIQVPVTTGGLVPCGREYDDPATTGWVESDDCTLCHLILMTQLVIEFLIKISAVVAAFFLAIAGFMYIFAAGKPEKITLAKQIFTRALFGFLIILISWVIIDTLLATFGYIDPLGDGTWHVMC